MKTTFLGRDYATPLWVASGTYGWGVEALDGGFWPKSLGAVVTKGVSPEPMDGAPHPRIVEVDDGVGVINAIGLQNPGLAGFLSKYAPRYAKQFPAPVWVNVLGSSLDGYVKVVEGVANAPHARGWLAGFELNVSCPNVDKGGVEFGADLVSLSQLVQTCVKAAGPVPVMVKLGPFTADVAESARRCQGAGAGAVALTNTAPAGLPNPYASRPGEPAKWTIGRRHGGLSGAALKPMSLRLVDLVKRALPDFPVCGIGGIRSADDVKEYLAAGASVVQVGTANFANPWLVDDIAAALGVSKL